MRVNSLTFVLTSLLAVALIIVGCGVGFEGHVTAVAADDRGAAPRVGLRALAVHADALGNGIGRGPGPGACRNQGRELA